MEDHYTDQVLRCRDCETDFVWTAGEQAFYASKGLANRPARCPACRVTARQAREAGPSLGRPREFFPAVCDRCGIQTQVPFLPRTDRPVYCSSCFEIIRTATKLG